LTPLTPFQKWINGLVGAAINGFTVIIGGSVIGIPTKQTFYLAAIQAGVGAVLYLKQNPTPWNGTDRRNQKENEQKENGK